MSKRVKIDLVSDVVCPWCALGFTALLRAIEQVPEAVVELHLQPFELNADAPAVGPEVIDYLQQKYGRTRAQIEQTHDVLRQRGAEVGLAFGAASRRMHNSFDAHRLLQWAATLHQQISLSKALFNAYFNDGANIADHAILTRLAAQAGLEALEATEILNSDRYAEAVREREAFYQQQGIHGVPAFIFNDRHLLEGAQPLEVLVGAIRQLAE